MTQHNPPTELDTAATPSAVSIEPAAPTPLTWATGSTTCVSCGDAVERHSVIQVTPRVKNSGPWSEDCLQLLQRLANEGLSGSEIAAQLNTTLHLNLTRNSVLGKLDRLKGRSAVGFWVPEKVEILKRLVAEGASSRAIADELGVKRQAVAKKAFYLGLQIQRPAPRPKSEHKRKAGPRRHKPNEPAAPNLPRLRYTPLTEEQLKGRRWRGIALEDLTSTTCRFPTGDGPFFYCGDTAGEGPYCKHHHSITHWSPR